MKKTDTKSPSLSERLQKLWSWRLPLSPDTTRTILVIFLTLLAIIIVLSAFAQAGLAGDYVWQLLTVLVGRLASLTPLGLLLVAVIFARFGGLTADQDRHPYIRVYLGAFLVLFSVCGLTHIASGFTVGSGLQALSSGGGLLGYVAIETIMRLFGSTAAIIILFSLGLIGTLVTFDFTPQAIWLWWKRRQLSTVTDESMTQLRGPVLSPKLNVRQAESFPSDAGDSDHPARPMPVKPPVEDAAPIPNKLSFDTSGVDETNWELPSFELLDDNKTEVDSGNIEQNVQLIQDTLNNFGIEVEMGEVNVGPTVTQYTLRPATGVKLAQIAGLQNDLALALAAHSIRMELPIPGKALVGIEVPNRSTAMVRLREVMQTSDFVNHKHRLILALGRDVAGLPQIADLAKMPHMLIAGATGTGKSVAINSLLISLLYRNTPQNLKLILVDPKRVELSLYNGIPHLLTPAITEPDKAVNALKWAVAEMDRRYRMLADIGKRNILDYNEVAEPKLSYIVIVVDELADLMAVAQNDVEAAIVRLAQMARAVGIHLVLATQRPSVEVITGLIKANITSRIAFAVASQIDSRTILDSSGAEKLLGNGDMLFTSAEFTKPKRVQGAYLGEKEVKRVVDFFKSQTGAVLYNDEITSKPERASFGSGGSGSDEDDLFEDAKDEVVRAGKASASLLQRRLRVGYSRAARLIDLLEQAGIVGPADGAKPREVYGVSDEWSGQGGVNPELDLPPAEENNSAII